MLSQQKTPLNTGRMNSNLVEYLQSDFQAFFRLDYQTFIKVIQETIPESLYLKGKANVSPEGVSDGKVTKNVYGLTEDEEIRAFSGLLRFKDVINGTEEDYNNFVACQIEMKKPVLSRESFEKMRQYIDKTLSSPEEYAAAMWSILCNDLGKVHSMIEAYDQLPNKKKVGHNVLLAELLKEKPELFPGFINLTEEHRKQIILGYASGCDISELEQLELPTVSLRTLKKLDENSLKLYMLHTIFDVAGAAAHFKPNGSLTLHEETWSFFNATREALDKLHQPENNSIEEAYATYLTFRGNCVGIYNVSSEATALIRIAGLARLATPEQGKMLESVWANLPIETKEILTRELSLHGGEGLRAIFIGYGVAMLLNSQGALQKELSEAAKTLGLQVGSEQRKLANMEGLKIGLINMGKVFQHTRDLIGHDAKSEIFVAECNEIARFLSKEPRKSLDMDFQFEKTSARRIDFKLVPRPSLQNEKENIDVPVLKIKKDVKLVDPANPGNTLSIFKTDIAPAAELSQLQISNKL